MEERAEVNVGVDVSKDKLDVSVRPLSERFTVTNDAAGHEELIKRLAVNPISRIVLEATGGYEAPAALALSRASLPVCIVNPDRCGTSRGVPVSSPRRTRSTLTSWHTSPRRSDPR